MMTGMNTEVCDPAELAALHEIFASRPEPLPPIGSDAVRSFEAEHGIVLPEPYRTFVAEVCDGLRAGPPYYGLLPSSKRPRTGARAAPSAYLPNLFLSRRRGCGRRRATRRRCPGGGSKTG